MAKYKVYVSDYDYPDLQIEKSILEPIGAEVIGLNCKTGAGLAELAADADGILQQYAKIPRSTIEKLTNCKIIARYGIGVDIVDVEAAYEHGMVVTNVPDYCLDEVADHAIAMSMMLIRNIPFYNTKIHQGSYQWQDWRGPIPRLRDSVYGLVGFGRIAQNIARKVNGFGFNLAAFDPYVSESFMATFGAKKVSLDTLMETANIVNVLTPYTTETHHLINEENLKKMKRDAYLVGVSRGKCIDNQALYKALTEGWLVGAALDDPEEEPMKLDKWSPDMNPLFQLDNCFFTPHTAYISVGALNECRHVAANNVKTALLGEKPFDLVKPRG